MDKEIALINKLYNKNLTLEDIPFDDAKTWEAFKTCNTKGVFQFSSPIAINVLKKMQCSNIEELSAANSFIRPGTGGLDDYVKGKMDPSSIKHFDPRIDKWLTSTYGAIVFQEQIMGLISELMGISFGKADIYRRALEKMHKPANKEKVDYFNNNVVDIAVSRGFTKECAESIRKMIIDNSGYAFNKSHAVCYSYISYYTAWMKVNYPLIFHETMLNGNLDNLGEFLDLAREDNVNLLNPDINYSYFNTTIDNNNENSLRIGFNIINGVGNKAVENIINIRPFKTINDYLERCDSKARNKKVVAALIKAGAFDNLGIKIDFNIVSSEELFKNNIKIINNLVFLNRKQLMIWYNLYLDANSPKPIVCYEIPISCFKGKYLNNYNLIEEDNNCIIMPEMFFDRFELNNSMGQKTRKKAKGDLKLMLEKEKSLGDVYTIPFIENLNKILEVKFSKLDCYLEDIDENGFSILNHPLQRYASKITNFKNAKDGDLCIEAGIILGMIEKRTKNDKIYYWLMIRTPIETIRITVWQNVYKKYKNMIKQYGLIAVRGHKGFGGMSLEDIKLLKKE